MRPRSTLEPIAARRMLFDVAVRSGFPILSTPNLQGLVRFYSAAFDAQRTYAFTSDDGRDVYVSLAIGGTQLGIAAQDGSDAGAQRVALWFYVDDVEDSYRRALDAGAISESAPTDMPWGERVARVRDPGGFTLHLGQEAGGQEAG